MVRNRWTVAAAIAVAALGSEAALAGTGCNGVINPLVWGCAPWDNNNGPKFPYFKASTVSIPQAEAKIVTRNGVQMVERNGQVMPIRQITGGSVIAVAPVIGGCGLC